MAAVSPLFAAERSSQVLQEPAQAAAEPEGPFLPESNHLRCLLRPRVESDRDKANRTPASRSTASNAALHHAPPFFKAENTGAFALNTLGGPPRAVSVYSSWRYGSSCPDPYNPHVFQSGGIIAPSPLNGCVDYRPSQRTRTSDLATKRSKSRADSGREIAPSWALHLEKPSG